MSVEIDLPYLMADRDRHGTRRLYVRRNGRKIRLRAQPGTRAFTLAYQEAIARLEDDGPGEAPRHQPGTMGWMATSYFGSQEFRSLDQKSQATRRSIIESCLQEPRKRGAAELMAECPVGLLSAAHVQMLRDRKQDKPGAANNRIKYLSAMFGWAVERRLLNSNPARDVRPIRYVSEGFYTWTLDDVAAFEKHHPIGTKARLALALLLYTGARRGDVVTFGRQHVKDGWLSFVPRKTRYKRAETSWKPILPELAEIIAASPTGDLTFLVTEYGQPFTAAGFGAWFRKRCDEAGLARCTAHGLRKAGATRAAELGASDRELMAIYDWTSASQATVYTAAADRKRMVSRAMKLLGKVGHTPTDSPQNEGSKKVVGHS